MKNKHANEQLQDYMDNLLEAGEREMVEAHLKECDPCAEEMSNLKELFHAFESEEKIIPPSSIKTKFLKQLEEEKKTVSKIVSLNPTSKRNPWPINFLKIAASVALLVGAFLTGKYQSDENSSKEIALLTEEKLEFRQTAMLSLMENQSASKRIQGVNYIEEFVNPDEDVVKALTDRMLYDQNTNVRLTAVEALSRFVKSETVKSAFISALGTEKDPSVQIALIQNLVKIQEKKAVDPMKKLLQQEDTQPFIKKEITQVLSEII